MARRNPMNERYQKHTAPAGKTRKSAAAAKPKRPTGQPATSGKGSSAGKGRGAEGRRVPINPPTPEFKRWQRIWWALLAGSLALVGIGYFVIQRDERVGAYITGAAYALIAAALYIDFAKLRKMRVEWQKSGGKLPDEGSSADDKS